MQTTYRLFDIEANVPGIHTSVGYVSLTVQVSYNHVISLRSCVIVTQSNVNVIVDIRLRPRSGAAPWCVSLSICRSIKFMLLATESLLRRLFLAIICKHDVIRATGNT